MITPSCPLDAAAFRRALSHIGLRVGFPSDADRAALPYVVRYSTLSRERLSDRRFEMIYKYAVLAAVRVAGRSGYLVEPIRDHRSILVGREFRFGTSLNAMRFRLLVDAAIAGKPVPLGEVAS